MGLLPSWPSSRTLSLNSNKLSSRWCKRGIRQTEMVLSSIKPNSLFTYAMSVHHQKRFWPCIQDDAPNRASHVVGSNCLALYEYIGRKFAIMRSLKVRRDFYGLNLKALERHYLLIFLLFPPSPLCDALVFLLAKGRAHWQYSLAIFRNQAIFRSHFHI